MGAGAPRGGGSAADARAGGRWLAVDVAPVELHLPAVRLWLASERVDDDCVVKSVRLDDIGLNTIERCGTLSVRRAGITQW